ncbi:pleckstrin homology domain-containing family M member 2-like [Haliotis rufescens]|uniref:pleckstrin homology domain-containing family M member 2-like n=1 Tax=Haliotis rufescens TaxID=6454 RepID=UPI00201EDC2C|nr:pleckstrin homology domain-containing family M member 2-like [Haliotis rufescens]
MSSPSDRMRLKDRIISNIAKAIKAIQEYQFYSGQESSILLTNSDWQCHKLCEHLDHALLHGLRHVTHGYWRMVNEFTRKNAIKDIERIQNITTDLGRGRAWIFMALNENLLESYLKCIADNSKFVKKFYVKEALVLDDQRMNLLLTLTSGLEMVCFQMECDVPYLDLSTYPPRSRSLSREKSQEEDKVSLHSMESIASRRSVSGVEMLASTPESNKVLTDSDSGSITSFETNGVMESSVAGSLSLDSGCHVDTNSIMSKQICPSTTDNVSTSSHGSGSEVEPRFRRIETIISVEEDIDQIETELKVIRVKSKGQKLKGKKSKRSSKVVEIPAMKEEVGRIPMEISQSPNIEFVEASILSSFKDVFNSHNDDEFSEPDPARSNMNTEASRQRTRSPGDGHEDVRIVKETTPTEQSMGDNYSQCDHVGNRVVSPAGANHKPVTSKSEVIPNQENHSSVQLRDNSEESVSENCDFAHSKRKIDSDVSFEEAALYRESKNYKKHHQLAENGLDNAKLEPTGSLDSAIVFSSDSVQNKERDRPSTSEKYFVGFHEDEDFYKVRRVEEVSNSETDYSAKRQDYVDFIVGDSDELKGDEVTESELESSTVGLDDLECEEKDYSIELDNNTLLCLMLDVFSHQDEQFGKMFCTSQGHTEGELKRIFLLVSDRAMYLLHQRECDHKFIKDKDIPFKDIDFLALSVNNQIINIVCTNRRKQFWLTTGNETLTCAITSYISSAMENCEFPIPKLTVLTDATTQKICMKKYAAVDARIEPGDVCVEGYSLVYWEDPHSQSAKMEHANREGTLLFKSTDHGKGHIWKPVYVILRDGMLCVFEDKNSKPQCFLRLGGEQCVGCRRSTDSDREHCIEVIKSDGGLWQFSAANHIEVSDWLQCLCKAVSEGSQSTGDSWSYLPCCSVLTHQKLLMCHEDVQTSFFRTLGSANMEEVTGITIDAEVKNYCILEFESQEARVSSVQWVLYFNSGSEMIRFTKAMSKCWEQQFQIEIPINQIDDAPLQTRCQETARHVVGLYTLK